MKFFTPQNRRARPGARARRRATTLVEAALCLTFILLPVTLGGLQFGMVFMTTHALQQVTREAGRFAAVHYSETTFDADENQGSAPGSTPSLRYVIRKLATNNGIAWQDIKTRISVTPGATSQRASGQPLTISVTYPMRKRAILGSLFFVKARNPNNINGGIKEDSQSLGFLQNDYTAASTFLME